MNDQQLENKVRHDTAKVKKDVGNLVEDGVSQLSEGFEKLTYDTREAVVGAVATVKKDVGHRLTKNLSENYIQEDISGCQLQES